VSCSYFSDVGDIERATRYVVNTLPRLPLSENTSSSLSFGWTSSNEFALLGTSPYLAC
jgi:hypothetical protein